MRSAIPEGCGCPRKSSSGTPSKKRSCSRHAKRGLVFRNKHDKRLSWEDTFKDMAREREDWTDFEGTIADGLDPAERW